MDIKTLSPRQNGRHFADDTCKRIFLNENVRISIKISLKFVPKSPIDNIPALFQIMAWRRPGDKPLSEAMMVSLLTHICVARPQWVKTRSQVSDPSSIPIYPARCRFQHSAGAARRRLAEKLRSIPPMTGDFFLIFTVLTIVTLRAVYFPRKRVSGPNM